MVPEIPTISDCTLRGGGRGTAEALRLGEGIW